MFKFRHPEEVLVSLENRSNNSTITDNKLKIVSVIKTKNKETEYRQVDRERKYLP